MKKALNAWSVPSEVPFDAMFASLAKAGFEGVELNVDRAGASAHALSLASTAADYAAIRASAERAGLALPTISTSLYANQLGSDDAAEIDGALRVLRKQLEAAQALGAEVVLVVPGGMTAQRSFAKAHRNVRTTLREIASEIEGSGVRVGLENVWNSFFGSPDDMARLIDDLGSPAIGAYFDVGNVAIFSSPEDWIEVLGKRIMAIHVKDFARAGGYGGSWANLLEGTIRWERVVQALQAAGFDGYLTAELPAMPNTPDFLYSITSQALDIIIAYGGAK